MIASLCRGQQEMKIKKKVLTWLIITYPGAMHNGNQDISHTGICQHIVTVTPNHTHEHEHNEKELRTFFP